MADDRRPPADGQRPSKREINLGLSEFRKYAPSEIEKRYKSSKVIRSPALVAPSLKRLRDLRARLEGSFVGREQAVRLLVACTMAGVPLVLFGPPGTAKSMIVREMARLCQPPESEPGRTYFEYLLTQHTMPEELFGPPKIDILSKQSRFERNTENMLPKAELAFLDEIFRGGSHILNALLAIVNERKFHDGPRVMDVPLVNVIGAANRPPEDPELAAFYDRFPIRVWLDSVFDGAAVGEESYDRAHALFEKSRRLAWRQAGTAGGDEEVACMNDFRLVHLHILHGAPHPRNTAAGAVFIQTFVQFRGPSRCDLSDRSLFPLYNVAVALALLEGKDSDEEHIYRSLFPHTARDREHFEDLRHELQGLGTGWEHSGRD